MKQRRGEQDKIGNRKDLQRGEKKKRNWNVRRKNVSKTEMRE
jgi:hypothetical protein